ncbi:MAG: Uma2 family endonuclease [Chloroflexota bacterium]
MTTETRMSASVSTVVAPVDTQDRTILYPGNIPKAADASNNAPQKTVDNGYTQFDLYKKVTKSPNGVHPHTIDYLYGPYPNWPRTHAEATRRSKGPYTLENVAPLLANEPIELYNGWPIWQVENVDNHHWPKNILEAYDRPRGPYTLENIETIISEESMEILHGWLVWKPMTNALERTILANTDKTMSMFAIHIGFGVVYPDNTEYLMSNGDVLIPDASLISWERKRANMQPHGTNDRPVFKGGPELVIEARSPSNTRKEEREKRTKYFANGVEVVWDVDEKRQKIWVYHDFAPTTPTEYGIDDTITCEFLPGWRRRVADLFEEELSMEVAAGEIIEESRDEGIAIGEERGIAIGKEEGRTEGIAIGKEEGRTEGIAIGKEEGRTEGIRQNILVTLPLLTQACFGEPLSDDVVQSLQSLDVETLQSLQASVATSGSLDAWLAQIA